MNWELSVNWSPGALNARSAWADKKPAVWYPAIKRKKKLASDDADKPRDETPETG